MDIFLSCLGLLLCAPLFVIIYLTALFDTGSPLFTQSRIGRNRCSFVLIKFRTMHIDTKSVATHLAAEASVTRLGKWLRRSKLDELPQLWNVLKGDMSLVGPRPNLENQTELIKERELRGVYNVRPGITGLAQINNIDMSTPEILAKYDEKMIQGMSVQLYIKLISYTLMGKGRGDAIDP